MQLDLTRYSRANAEHTLSRLVGRWLVVKARQQATTVGTQQAARNLKRQGVPLALAVSILRMRSPK